MPGHLYDHLTLYRTTGYRASLVGLYTLTILLGLFLFGAFETRTLAAPPVILPTTKQPVSTPERVVITGRPIRIVIPDLELDIQIKDGIYNPSDGSWTLDFANAFFALPSVLPNDLEGNTFIYGHSSREIFGKLWRLNPGALVWIYTAEGPIFQYKYRSLRNLSPEDVSVFNYQGSPILTLQTCTGNWQELRRMYEFSLEKVL